MILYLKAIRKRLTLSNLLNGIFTAAIIIFLFNPSAKALLIRGLMKVGLFQPDLSQPSKPAPNKTLPDISFQSADGRLMNLVDQKGKVIFINFWATWCPPCIAEMPSINDLYEKLKYNKNIVFIMVDADHDFNKSVPFMTRHQFTLPLYEASNPIPEDLLGSSIPTTVIIDKSGRMVFHHEGADDYGNEKVLAYLLKLSK